MPTKRIRRHMITKMHSQKVAEFPSIIITRCHANMQSTITVLQKRSSDKWSQKESGTKWSQQVSQRQVVTERAPAITSPLLLHTMAWFHDAHLILHHSAQRAEKRKGSPRQGYNQESETQRQDQWQGEGETLAQSARPVVTLQQLHCIALLRIVLYCMVLHQWNCTGFQCIAIILQY